MSLSEVKEAIGELKWEGEQEHDGPKIDLSRILSRVIHNYERQGIEWCLERYWVKQDG